MEKHISIIIADDHPVLRAGLREIIESDPYLRISGTAGDGEEALREVRSRKPDVLLLDIEMPILDGLEVARQLHEEDSRVAILVLTMHQEDSVFNRAMDYGVSGYLLKDSAEDDILEAIRAVLNGRCFVSPALTAQALDFVRKQRSADEKFRDLSGTEYSILVRIAESKTSGQIGEELNLSPRTIEKHRLHIGQKLGLRGSYSLLRYALENREKILRSGT
ncbi:MAG: response regulator transcription factor [Bacteroidetes bacterium]|nr:response regulator transcription factor [Bacteroidota bacterium]